MDSYKMGLSAVRTAIVVNVALCTFKILAGIIGKSTAMLADGVHTLSDILATSVAAIGLKIAAKDADDEHQYGHERYESLFAKIISTILIITGFFIGSEGIKALIKGNIEIPGRIALIAAIISIVLKEGLYQNTIRTAKKINSISLEADAWHHRSDALSSVGTFVGILGARLGAKVLDPIAGIIVSVLIIKVGVEFWIKASEGLVDMAAPSEIVKEIKKITMDVEGVKGINSLKTRLFGNRLYVDIEIAVDGNISVQEGHDIAEEVHNELESTIEGIKHCMVHVDPYIEEKTQGI
ncbi:MAG TPA: cation transporter [Clostridiales bacterium]|nr:cation transporter [Clostridiales bacterium]